jgi:hypothetical protein
LGTQLALDCHPGAGTGLVAAGCHDRLADSEYGKLVE